MQHHESPSLRSRAACLSLVALLVAATAFAQGWRGAGRAKGVVLGPAGKPVGGASVAAIGAEDEGGGPKAEKTDAKGRWTLIGLTAGEWKLKIEANGFQPFADDFTVYAQGAPDTLRATLTPVPKEELEA